MAGIHRYTVGQLKKQLKDMPDDMIVAIERVEDVYFKKYKWTTETYDFCPDQPGLETVEYIDAFGVAKLKKDNVLVICAHY